MIEGKYIVIEGHDGTGKSTQVALLREILRQRGIDSVEMHEPAGVEIADRLRDIIKNGSLPRDATTNLLLFTAARRELWNQLAKPALEKGEWVVAARNWYSTLAYQGYGEGLDPQLITNVTQQFMPDDYLQPDAACILTLKDEGIRAGRLDERPEDSALDAFEARAATFQENVKQGYLKVARQFSLPTIDAGRSREAILQDITQLIDS